jgi:hypothetical protein
MHDNTSCRAPADEILPDTVLLTAQLLRREGALSQHEADGSEFEESESAAIEILPILGQSAATVQPSDRTFEDV